MFRLIKPSSGQNHSTGIQLVRTMVLAWWWLNEPKHVAKFVISLILITNVCCAIDKINLLYPLFFVHQSSWNSSLYDLSF